MPCSSDTGLTMGGDDAPSQRVVDERHELVRLSEGWRFEVYHGDVSVLHPVFTRHVTGDAGLVEGHQGSDAARAEVLERPVEVSTGARMRQACELVVNQVSEVAQPGVLVFQAGEKGVDRPGDLEVDLDGPYGVTGDMDEVSGFGEVDDVATQCAGAVGIPGWIGIASDEQLTGTCDGVALDSGDGGLAVEQRGEPDGIEPVVSGDWRGERSQRLGKDKGAVSRGLRAERRTHLVADPSCEIVGAASVTRLFPPDLLHGPAVLEQALPAELEQRMSREHPGAWDDDSHP